MLYTQRRIIGATLSIVILSMIVLMYWTVSTTEADVPHADAFDPSVDSTAVVVFTATMYKGVDDLRMQLAIDLCSTAQKFHIRLVVVDGSPPDVQAVLGKHCRNLFTQKTQSRGGAIREAITHCLQLNPKPTILLWQEPEKVDLLRFHSSIAEPILNSKADIVMPRRSTHALSTYYPPEQYHSESFGNLLLDEYALRYIHNNVSLKDATPVDWLFGPFAFNVKLANHWLDYNGTHWNAQLVPIINALQVVDTTNRLQSVEVEYRHSAKQKAEETGSIAFTEKRLMQLRLLVADLKEAWVQSVK
eukprot:TRINITY_DN63453_c0_g1_i1.p2 TRINITY_DN63453_c0_g1~~TRINITY_DN63453_c0_g1_i1.p2  ORF type:complete len:303 (-),score=43.29 TRINITY_DN63453_c0_g1_i1:1113-2021(-)